MTVEKIPLQWVTANRTFVGGPAIGYVLQANHCYQIPLHKAREFHNDGFQGKRGSVTMGKEKRDRTIVKPFPNLTPERKKRVVKKDS